MTASITVADVGHGNSTLVRDEDFAVLVDAAPGGIPEALIRGAGLTALDHVVISHADRDHVGGLPSVLRQFKVGNVWINGEARRAGRTWDSIRAAVTLAEQERGTIVRNAVAHGTDLASPSGRVEIKVLAPTGGSLLWGVGAAPRGEVAQTPNSLSAVVAVFVDGVSQALLTGDAGGGALKVMMTRGADLSTTVLVFPHHGGLAGRENLVTVARDYVAAVTPDEVIFSVGRRKRGFPRPEVVDAVRSENPQVHVACTQLNVECSATTPVAEPDHLSPLAAAGRSESACCAGTVRFGYDVDAARVVDPRLAAHASFVSSLPGVPMCRRPLQVRREGA